MPKNTQVLKQLDHDYVVTAAMLDREQSLVRAIKLLLDASDVDALHRKQLIDIALWKYTEASGMNPHPKYNLRYVSDGARDLDVEASLNHEHVAPKKWLLKRLFEPSSWDIGDLSDFLSEHAVACVVTVREHALLGDQTGSGWSRYANAGVSVWDRQQKAYLDLGAARPLTSQRVDGGEQPSTPAEFDLRNLIADRAGDRATYLHQLTRMARFASAVAVVAVTSDGQPSKYFRIHDTSIPEPTHAVAYPHWSGKVDFALAPDDVPTSIMGEVSVKVRKHNTYAVSCKVTDEAALEIAEELLFLALEKLRGERE